MPSLHPELARAQYLPTPPVRRSTVRLFQRLTRGLRPGKTPQDLVIEDLTVPGAEGAPPVGLRVYRPRSLARPAPALLWAHGGGYVMGSPVQDEAGSIAFARELGITVVSLRYRLAPQHPAPAALEDAYSALVWVSGNAEELLVDPRRIAIGGASAGGGLAAALALLCHDRGGPDPVFQLLVYPMLDDRTVLRTDMDTSGVRLWSPANNRYAWGAYLGRAPGGEGISPYAAPARREDLGGLPPAWIGVGTADLFHDEDTVYAERLRAAGVPCELTVVPGAFHGFNAGFPRTGVAQRFREQQVRALREALYAG
ncbi:alpha/beta hydrolase [Nocardiopsis algeriensis]|uniref:Acetyl esterase/lipase n=1 Tax=Nocardiopsis algeriensis TaxID=1478215 RepID=A0A841IQH1_9ACTN|nr:alpha/beta hydrolase [Nocardiopsis algeriensis]MBB6118571.1 acetyl esterase/lipase [Nocardiopsis algeriensis]